MADVVLVNTGEGRLLFVNRNAETYRQAMEEACAAVMHPLGLCAYHDRRLVGSREDDRRG